MVWTELTGKLIPLDVEKKSISIEIYSFLFVLIFL